MATGGIGKSYKVTSNSWEYTGDGHALALRAGATLINMEFVQFHPTGMVWPPSVKGILVTEGVRGDGGVLKNSEGKRFMFEYIPPVFKGQYAETIEEADQWLKDNDSARRTPDLLPRDEVARAINSEVKAGRNSPHGGVFLDIASRLPAEEIKRRLPSMYHQFMELAEVDITKEPMEVGPTCHYVMGGIEVDPDTGAATTPGLFAAGECSGGMHGSNRLGGNSLSDLLVFGRRAGLGASDYVRALAERPKVSEDAVAEAAKLALAPFDGPRNGEAAENPYTLQLDLQDTMNSLVGIIRNADEVSEALGKLTSCGSGSRICRWKAIGSSTRAGIWPSTFATCCWSASAWPRPRWSAPRAAAATPATTTRRWIRTGARRCWCAGPSTTGPTRSFPTSASPARTRCRCART